MKRTVLAVSLTTLFAAPVAIALPANAAGPCKTVESAANHCDQNGKNDISKHPQSDENANWNSDCNARNCSPAPTPSPSPSPTSSPSPSPSPSPTSSPTSSPSPSPTATSSPSPSPSQTSTPLPSTPPSSSPEPLTVSAPAAGTTAEDSGPEVVSAPRPATVSVPAAATLPSTVPAGDGSTAPNGYVPAAIIALAAIAAVSAGYRLIRG